MFVQARWGFGGNYYIDHSEVISASKVQLLQLDIIPTDDAQHASSHHTATLEQDLEMLQINSENLLHSHDCETQDHFVAGLTLKYDTQS